MASWPIGCNRLMTAAHHPTGCSSSCLARSAASSPPRIGRDPFRVEQPRVTALARGGNTRSASTTLSLCFQPSPLPSRLSSFFKNLRTNVTKAASISPIRTSDHKNQSGTLACPLWLEQAPPACASGRGMDIPRFVECSILLASRSRGGRTPQADFARALRPHPAKGMA
jgi:hypothetical protein